MSVARVKNRDQLLSHGHRSARQKAISIIEEVLKACDPGKAARELVHVEGDTLTIGHLRIDLKRVRNIYVLGAGKATFPIAEALEEILGDLITDGLIILKRGYIGKLERIKIVEASHPLPDVNGFEGAQMIMRLAEKAGPNDIVFCTITGGSSALMPLPAEGISLEEKIEVNRLLLESGASIIEINSVRKHLSRIKGGLLAKAVFPATLVNLTVSDVIGDPWDYITGPTVPDTSTFEDARRTLTRYRLWDKVPKSVKKRLLEASPGDETPKSFKGMPLHNFLLISADAPCEVASRAALSLGLAPLVISTCLEGESREAGIFFASMAKEIKRHRRPVAPPCALIAGGETTVSIGGERGLGGPNQEFAVSAGLRLADDRDALCVGIDTDGTDGPTDFAGGMVDRDTVERAEKRGMDLCESLARHDVSTALMELGDTVLTGQTGTNVNDLKLMIIEERGD